MNRLAAFLLSYAGETTLLVLGACSLVAGYRVDFRILRQSAIWRNVFGIVTAGTGLAAIAFALHGLLFHSTLPQVRP